MNKLEFDDISKGGQPRQLIPLIGRTVLQAWLIPTRNHTLMLGLRGGKILMLERVRGIGFAALSIEIGDILPGADWSDIERFGQDPHLKALINRKFTGLDQDVVMFDNEYGCKLSITGVEWVKVNKS